jgi:hypothetical protein
MNGGTSPRAGCENKELRVIGAFPSDARDAGIFTHDAGNHDSTRHAACLQLLAKRLLRAVAMSLNSKKIQTIGIRIRSGSLMVSIQGGHCSVQSIQKAAA